MVFKILSTSLRGCGFYLSTRGGCVKKLSICAVDNKNSVEKISTAYKKALSNRLPKINKETAQYKVIVPSMSLF